MPNSASRAGHRTMITGANELAAHATAHVSSAQSVMPAGPARIITRALARLGYDVESLLSRAGLRIHDLDDPDAVVPCEALDTVLRAALEQRRVPNFAARMAFETPVGAYPLLDYLVLTTDTVGDAIRQLAKYFHVLGTPQTIEIDEDENAVRLLIRPGRDPNNSLHAVSIIVHHLRQESEQRLRVSFVSLIHEPEDPTDLQRLLGCPLRAPSPWCGIEFRRDALDAPLRRRDPILRRVLENQATASVGGSNVSPPGTVALVRRVLAARIGRGIPEIDDVARQLAVAPRTLQRRLAAEGMSFKELVDLVRRDAAERLLADRSLAVAEIAYLLGFSEPGAFHRAFRRWHGVTPVEYRRRAAR